MTVINTNTAAINAQYNLSKVQSAMDDAMSALSSGKRINSAADDAAGLSIITRMESQVRGLNQAMKNAADGQNMIATAEGAMDEMTNMLQRMRELAIQASNDTMSDTDRKNLNAEVDQLVAEIDRVVDTTTYNDIKLLDGSFSGSFQIGAKSGESMSISVGNLSTTALGTSMVGVANSASVSNSSVGDEANATITQLAFNGNDTYGFTLKLGDASDTNVTFAGLSGAVVAGDAEAVATAIRSAISANVNGLTPDFSVGDIDVQANGNIVTIKNNVGGKIDISAFTASGAGTMNYTSISGTGDSKTLGGLGVDAAVTNSGGTAASPASEDFVLQTGKDYSFRVNGEYIEVSNFEGTGGTTDDELLAKLKAAVGDNNAVTLDTNAGATRTYTLANTDGADIEITNFNAVSEPAGAKGNMSLSVRVDENNSFIGDMSFVDGGSDWAYVDGKDAVQLSFSDDTANYSFDIEGTTYTVDRASFDSMAEALLDVRDTINTNGASGSGHALAGKVEARVVDGRLEIENLQNAASGPRGTITSTATANAVADVAAGDIQELTTPDTSNQTFNDDLDYQLIQEGDKISLAFSQADADYSFRLSSALGSDAIGGTLDIHIQTASKNQTLAEALVSARDQINEHNNLSAVINGNALEITYENQEGLPAIKNLQGQDLGASTTIGSNGTEDYQQLTMLFTEAAADYQFKISNGTTAQDTTIDIQTSGGASLAEQLQDAVDALNADANYTHVTFVAGGDTIRITSSATNTSYTISALKSKNEAVKLENFVSTGNQHMNNLEIDNFSSTAKQAVAAGTATANGGATNLATAGSYTMNGTEAVATESYIQVSGDDTYEFTLTGAGGGETIRADVAGGSLIGLANAINAHSGTEKITASVDGSTLKLRSESGGNIAITGFTSVGSGTFNVTHAAGQGSAEVLNDDAAAVGASTASAGLATASTMNLQMSGSDTVTFNISDGDTIAKVRAVTYDPTNNAAALAEIQSALSAAGSSITASAANGTADIVLTNSSGGQIKLTEFTSDSTATMTATPGAGQGVGKILDDTGLSGSGSALSAVNLASQEGADDALAIIDAAMENINSTRSELGAMSNRLDHTINNLGNVVVNTEASQSRIEDADFATETSNLTKAQILSQAATAMLAQANASKQSVLSLLQG